MSIFIAPGQTQPDSARNSTKPSPTSAVCPPSQKPSTPVVDPLDQRILDYANERVGFAVRSWTMVNELTKSMMPSSEAERRRVVKALLQRLKALLHSRVIRRVGRYHIHLHVDGQPAPQSPWMRNIPRRRRRVRRKQVLEKRPVSVATAHIQTLVSPQRSESPRPLHTTTVQSVTLPSPANTAKVEPSKTKSAQAIGLEVPDERSAGTPELDTTGLAAKIKRRIASLQAGPRLAKHRWAGVKKWTGFVNGQRCRRGQRVLMLDGVGGELMFARRGLVLVFADRRASVLHSRFRRVEQEQLVVCKMPEAVLLGARKLGRRERPSERKAAACRRNGACPVRPGSRPRGRPRMNRVTLDPIHSSHRPAVQGHGSL